MEIQTTRFGTVEVNADDVLLFPTGLLAFEGYRHWVLLADADNEAIGWLQSATHPELAMAVVSPRRFVPGYQLRVSRSELAPVQLDALQQAYLLVVVGRSDQKLTLNLKAPLVVNLQRRLGRQVVANDDQPVQYALTQYSAPLRKSA